MSFALVWQYAQPSTNETKVIIGHPGTWSDSDTQAVEEGRAVLAGDELTEEERSALQPLAVVEVSEEIGEDIQEQCEEVEVGTDLLFYDLDTYARWQKQPWWPKI